MLTRAGILQTFVINFVLAAIAWVEFCFVRPKFPKAYKARATQYVSLGLAHVNIARVLRMWIEVMSANLRALCSEGRSVKSIPVCVQFLQER